MRAPNARASPPAEPCRRNMDSIAISARRPRGRRFSISAVGTAISASMRFGRGAARVLATTDHYVWHSQWDRGSFDLVRERLAPELEVKDIHVYDISPATGGTFDVVLFIGVFYHTRHPLLALERAGASAPICWWWKRCWTRCGLNARPWCSTRAPS
jgi:hypothetical protein